MKKICIVTTLWSSIHNWIQHFLNAYNENNIEVTVVCNMDKEFEEKLLEKYPFVRTYSIDFPRGIDFKGSIKSILELIKFFKKNSFDMVQYSTPNASVYTSIAAKITKIPVRLYCQWGMVFMTMKGKKKWLFEKIERMVCKFSTHIQPDSPGNLEYCRKNGFYDENKSSVVWNGSAKGLEMSDFDIDKKIAFRKEIREKYNIDLNDPVIGFVGRLGKEKGCNELFKAFKIIKEKYKNAKLLFVGPIEKEETIEPELLDYFYNCDDIIKTGRVNNVEKYTSAMDIFVLPSYREGFGMGVIEASAMEVPVIVTKYPGPSSAMKENVTGFSVDVFDVENIVKFIEFFLDNPEKAKEMGKNGRIFAKENFDRDIFTQKYMENRLNLLGLN